MDKQNRSTATLAVTTKPMDLSCLDVRVFLRGDPASKGPSRTGTRDMNAGPPARELSQLFLNFGFTCTSPHLHDMSRGTQGHGL